MPGPLNRGRETGELVVQPENRDAAAGVFLPLAHVRMRDPKATVVIYPSDQALVSASKKFVPGVVIADISVTILNGLQAASQIRVNAVETGVIFLTVHGGLALVREAEKCGALGYVLKRSAADHLITATREVMK